MQAQNARHVDQPGTVGIPSDMYYGSFFDLQRVFRVVGRPDGSILRVHERERLVIEIRSRDSRPVDVRVDREGLTEEDIRRLCQMAFYLRRHFPDGFPV